MPNNHVIKKADLDSFWFTNQIAASSREILEAAIEEGGSSLYARAVKRLLRPIIEDWPDEKFDKDWRDTVLQTLRVVVGRGYGGEVRPRPPEDDDSKPRGPMIVVMHAPRPEWSKPRAIETEAVQRPRRKVAG